jgi:Zn-dependent peptidase ImmA (M78 family)
MKYVLTPLESEIKKLYHTMGIQRPDQIELCEVAAKLNIWIHFEKVKSRAFDHDGLFSIVIDSRILEPEQWQDFGHELGHVLNHDGDQLDMDPTFREFQEIKANNFAQHFCVPTFMILDSGLPYTWNEAILYVMDTFNVTDSFARKRLMHFNNQVIGFEFHKAIREAQREAELVLME